MKTKIFRITNDYLKYGFAFIFLALITFFIFCLPACTPSAPKIQMHFHTSDSMNPDINGKASPVVLNVYELRNQNKFNDADFSTLEDASRFLGHQLVDQNSMELLPGAHRSQILKIAPGTHYIGFTAGFRALEQSTWKKTIPVPSESSRLLITVSANAISIKTLD